jgi:Flp pilus assembly protein TadG
LNLHTQQKQYGVVAVEFAILAPLLFLILFGIINWGVLLFDKAVITNAAREGARWAAINATSSGCDNSVESTPDDPCAVAYTYAKNYLITFGATPNLTSTYSDATTTQCTTVYGTGCLETVVTSYTFTGIGYAVSAIIGSAGSLSATSKMYHE